MFSIDVTSTRFDEMVEASKIKDHEVQWPWAEKMKPNIVNNSGN